MTDAAQDFEEDTWSKGAGDALEAPPLPEDRTVPLNLLDEGGDDNVRTSATKSEIESLMMSIMHRGLLQALVVAPIGERYKVGAGNRRLKALQLAQKRGLVPKDHPVPIRFAKAEDLHEISLTENVMRVALHPVDEYEAFTSLKVQGLSETAIADRFGLKEKAVRQRLALGSLAPEVRKAWRDGRLGQEQAQLFTLTDDHEVQRQALKTATANKSHFPEWQVASILRSGRPSADNGTFAFVGREAYLAAGGTLREDLFGKDVLIEDPAILARLAGEKLDAICKALVDEQGWSFAQRKDAIRDEYAWSTLDLVPFATPEEKAALNDGPRHGATAWQARTDLHARVAEIPAARAMSGVLVSVNYRGEVELSTLRQRPLADDAADDAGEADDDDHDDDDAADDRQGQEPEDAEEAEPDHGLSKAITEELSEQLGQAVAECLVADPDLALAAIVATLNSSRWGSPFKIALDGSPARKRDHSSKKFTDVFAECVTKSREALLVELATALGGAINITSVSCSIDKGLPAGRDELIGAFDEETFRGAVSRAFMVSEFFERAPAKVAKAAVEETRGHSVGGKKSDVVGVAVSAARESGWLPGPLRTVHYEPPVPPLPPASEG